MAVDPEQRNRVYFDMAVRHQIGVRRFTAGEVRRTLRLLEKADKDLVRQLRDRLRNVPRGRQTTKRLKELLKSVRQQRLGLIQELRGQFNSTLKNFAVQERDIELRLLGAAHPDVTIAAPTVGTLRTIVNRNLFDGQLLDDWYKSLELADRGRLNHAIQLGLAQGEPTNAIVRRVVGTRAEGFSNGALATTRRNAEAIVRTAVNGVSNAARETVWGANEDIIEALLWSSVLDGRTSAICRARSNKLTAIGDKPLPPDANRLEPPEARPPAHVACRSVMIAVLEGFPVERENYNDWLKRQPNKFQDEVLGKTDGKLFRKGGLEMDEYVDRAGNELTLSQLARTKPEAFARANLPIAGFLD